MTQLYFIEIHTHTPLEKNSFLTVEDGVQTLLMPVRKGHSQHYFGNLPLYQKPCLSLDQGFQINLLESSTHPRLSAEQKRRNEGLTSECGIVYKAHSKGVPRRAVIAFPQHRGFGGWATPYPILSAEKFELNNTLYISFQDPYLSSGSYFLSDNYGASPVSRVIDIIRRYLTLYGLRDSQCTFIGSSKGANIAAMISQHFSDNQLLLFAYSTDLVFRFQNNFLRHLLSTFRAFNVEIPDALDILRQEATRKETHWFFSIGDTLANRGCEGIKEKHLRTYGSLETHGNVLRGNWDLARSLILSRHY